MRLMCFILILLHTIFVEGRQNFAFERLYRPDDRIAPGPDGGRGYCGPDEATCRNGECVKRENICDGEFDCRDRSDESDCGSQKQCEPNEFVCYNRRCVQKMWVCDGEDDCGDNTDESDCGTAAPGELCAPFQFKCQRGDQCMPKNFQCDGQNDCQDGSDEIGCSEPVVVQPPEPQKSVCLGSTLVLTCRAVGVPAPHISWRLNWGPVCDPPRCTQTSVDGYGVLTIHNANDRDQGAYSCEAINSRKRILATPDAIVTVRRCDDVQVTEEPANEQNLCHLAGIAASTSDGRCHCKHYVTGPYCDRCIENSFNLAPRNPQGCTRCFCMGVTRQCQSSDQFRSQQRLAFRGEGHGVTVSDFSERQVDQNPVFDYTIVPNAITLSAPQPVTNYWRLPANLLGNKLTAYGGVLKFVIQYNGQGQQTTNPLVVLKGNEIILVHTSNARFQPDTLIPFEIGITEADFTREDGRPTTREHLLMTLAGLESLLIRQVHCQSQYSSSLGEVSLDVAVPEYTGQQRADAVEKCSCPTGYIGLSCEECAPGYRRSGGGLYLGNCEPGSDQDALTTRPWNQDTFTTPRPWGLHCDPAGSLSPRPDPRTGVCRCKEHTTGQLCDQCKPQTFCLDQRNPHGCITCFCSGVTRDCQSSRLYRQEQTVQNFHDWVVPVRTGESINYETLTTPAIESDNGRVLKFESFHEFRNGRPLYFELPAEFHGNKISAYGGKLRIKFTYSAHGLIEDQNPCVVLRGNDIALFHTTQDTVYPDRENVVVMPLYEHYWQREDRYPSTREHLLMTLADLNTLLIKITWKQGMRSFSLLEVTLDYASHIPSNLGVASAVEQCRCPEGYLGSSCEDCASGYTRTGGGLYLGLCEPCFCNGHADDCDPDYGECKNCQHNTHGLQCEHCKPEFYGDASRGSPNDCQPTHGGSPVNPDDRRRPDYSAHEPHPDHNPWKVDYQGGITHATPSAEKPFVTEEPATEEPVTDEPVTDEPTTDEPVTDEPVTDEPVTEEPVTDEPVTDQSVTDEPVTDAPVTDEPVTDMTTESTTETATDESPSTSTGSDDGDYTIDVDDEHHPDEPGARGDLPENPEATRTEAPSPSRCAKCECHNHSPTGCDDDCKCLECHDNTEGDQCEKCKHGFYGDSATGSPFDCQECPCTEAESCFVDTDEFLTCRGCPKGYAGRLCDDCAPGYVMDEEKPLKCKLQDLARKRKIRKQRKLLHHKFRT